MPEVTEKYLRSFIMPIKKVVFMMPGATFLIMKNGWRQSGRLTLI